MRILAEKNGHRFAIDENTAKIRLSTERFWRTVGIVRGKTIVLNRVRAKHLHRASSSYGVNYLMLDLLPNLTELTELVIYDDFGTWSIPIADVKTCSLMNFKNADDGNVYELQYFVPLWKLKPVAK